MTQPDDFATPWSMELEEAVKGIRAAFSLQFTRLKDSNEAVNKELNIVKHDCKKLREQLDTAQQGEKETLLELERFKQMHEEQAQTIRLYRTTFGRLPRDEPPSKKTTTPEEIKSIGDGVRMVREIFDRYFPPAD